MSQKSDLFFAVVQHLHPGFVAVRLSCSCAEVEETYHQQQKMLAVRTTVLVALQVVSICLIARRYWDKAHIDTFRSNNIHVYPMPSHLGLLGKIKHDEVDGTQMNMNEL